MKFIIPYFLFLTYFIWYINVYSPYLEDCIKSVLDADFDGVKEIIIVDDWSTDNSYKKVASLNNEKIHLVKNKKKGACSARNYAFELANSDYIQYLDADDLINPEKLENQLKILTKKEDSISYGLWARFINNINNEKIKLLETHSEWLIMNFLIIH